MKRTRKGFTLVELLIVVAMIGVLSSIMMLNVTGSTGRAKAMTIANNVNSCKTAASLYYGQVLLDSGATTAKTSDVLGTYVSSWSDFANGPTIKYTIPAAADSDTEGSETTYTGWAINVDFSEDNDKDEIVKYLANIPGFSTVGSTYKTTYKFQVKLWDGTLAAYAE